MQNHPIASEPLHIEQATEEQISTPATKKKKKKTVWIVLGSVLGCLVCLSVAAIFILGSLGAPQTPDMQVSQKAYLDALTKLGILPDENQNADEIELPKDQNDTTASDASGQEGNGADGQNNNLGGRLAKTTLTSEQASSLFHFCLPKDGVLKSLRLTVTADNRVQVWGEAYSVRAAKMLQTEAGLPDSAVKVAESLPEVMPFSCVVDGNITDNRVAGMKMTDMRIGSGLMGKVMQDMLAEMPGENLPVDQVVNFLIHQVTSANGIQINSAYAKDGGLVIEGHFPPSLPYVNA